MIADQTVEGSFLNVKLDPQPMPMRTAAANRAQPRPEPNLNAHIITVRFEKQGDAVTEIRAEFVLDHASYAQAEAAGHFGLSAEAKSAPMDASSFSPDASIHILATADMERVGPYQFDGLDIMNNENDLLEILDGITFETPQSVYHELDTWTFITVQQKASPDSAPVGFDRKAG